ncbi:MAG: xanthine dehydrogenase family protein molybdopterin-binding subunit [Alphaproteobacteria bacterium]|nr:xanthine dehydrogenase family protein molybdopterin-binding subunit [Alphaproteobacteria bacterium]
MTSRRTNTYIGAAIERFEDLRFLRGRGIYVDDVPHATTLHAAILRSSVAHGLIRVLDATEARRRPGVVAVITAAEIGPVPVIPIRLAAWPSLEPFVQPVIAADRVRFVGEPIAVVVADTAARAEDALEAIALEIEPLPVVADRDASAAGAILLFPGAASNRAITYEGRKGDAAAAFRSADYTRREHFSVQRHTAIHMEPRGIMAEWDRIWGRLTIWGASKVPYPNRKILAGQIGVDPALIDMIENDAGGGFGVRGEFYPEDFLIPFAARHVGRAVKWIEDRREHLIAANHAREVECTLEIACRRDGRILAFRGHARADLGAYVRTNGVMGPRNVAQILSGPYDVANIEMDVELLLTNKTPAGTYRAPGRFEADFFRERLIEMAARDLGIDRIAFRRMNLVPTTAMPYALATINPLESTTHCDSGDFRQTLDRCLAEFDWATKSRLSGADREGRRHGVAVSCYIEGGASGPREDARLILEPDGTLSVHVGSSSVGQGVETIFAQIAADALGVPIERLRSVRHGSTGLVTEGFGAYSSRSTVMGGSAVLDAAAKLEAQIRARAAARFGCAPDAVLLRDGTAIGPDLAAIDYAALAGDGLVADGTFLNERRTHSYGAHAAHVSVDPRTGHVAVHDYVAVEDVGRIINPETLHGQTVGAIVQGLGGALLEHLVYDGEGQLLTGSLADYLMPTASDFPVIRGVALEEHPSPVNPLGAKGAGEGGIIPVGGVIANAVADALAAEGVQPTALPLSPPRVWALVEAARNGRK